MTSSEVGLLRLVAQRLAGPRPGTAAEAVRRLTAVQGQDYPGALTSVALRTRSGARSDVEAALDAGEIVRSWPMRGTLHLVAAEDLPWLLELLTPRVLAGAAARRAGLGITEHDVEHARGVARAALGGGRRLRRSELLAALSEGGVDTSTQRGYHLLGHLSQTGTLCMGPTSGKEQLFVLLDEWIRSPRRLEREEALGELARRFFTGHGPATVADLARWAGLTLRDVRAGLAIARPALTCIEVDGAELFMDPETPDRLAACRREAAEVFLLPGFDEFVLGYADRGAVLPPEFADRIVPGGNGMFRSTVVHEGRVVGTWRWVGTGARRTLSTEPFHPLPAEVVEALPTVAARLP